MKKKKLLVTILCLQLLAMPIERLTTFTIFSKTASAAVSNIQPYANHTGYKYKFENGKTWKRLWSYTYNRWEEPNWTLA